MFVEQPIALSGTAKCYLWVLPNFPPVMVRERKIGRKKTFVSILLCLPTNSGSTISIFICCPESAFTFRFCVKKSPINVCFCLGLICFETRTVKNQQWMFSPLGRVSHRVAICVWMLSPPSEIYCETSHWTWSVSRPIIGPPSLPPSLPAPPHPLRVGVPDWIHGLSPHSVPDRYRVDS